MNQENETQVLARPQNPFSLNQLLLITVFLVITALAAFAVIFVSRLDTEPQRETSLKETSPRTPEEAAELGGYQILYKDPKDRLGRTVVTSGRGIYDGGGIFYFPGDPQSAQVPIYLIARIVSVSEVPDSADLFLELNHPLNNSLMPKVRIDRTVDKLDSPQPEATAIYVDLLAHKQNIRFVANVADSDKTEIEQLILPGDVIVVLPAAVSDENGKWNLVGDDEGNWVAEGIILRRFEYP